MKVYDCLAGFALILCIVWGVGETANETTKKKEAARIEAQNKKMREVVYKNPTNWEDHKAVAQRYESRIEEKQFNEQKERIAREIMRSAVYSITTQQVDGSEEEEVEEEPTTGRYTYEDLARPQRNQTAYVARKFSYDEDNGNPAVDVGRKTLSYAQREDAEISSRLDDFVGGVDPRRGQTIKTGSTAFREDGDMVIVTGSTIHTSRGMWVDTGGVILGPQGQSMLRVGSMIYENGIVKSQKIGGDDGDYYLRRGYSLNQSSQTLTDFDSP